MPQYKYMLYLFQVDVFDAAGQSIKKPAYLWHQLVTDNPAVNFRETVVFDNRDQMFLALQNSGLLSATIFADADLAFRESGWFNSTVYVPFGKETAIRPNLVPEPGTVIPSEEYTQKLEAAKKSRR